MPSNDGPGPVTELLAAHGAGGASALERLVGLVYGDLRRLARRQLGGGDDSVTLDTTALVHEAYLKTLHREELPWRDRGHLLAVSARGCGSSSSTTRGPAAPPSAAATSSR